MDSHDLENLRSMLNDGQKIQAIAAIRNLENIGLKEAHELARKIEAGAGLLEVSADLGSPSTKETSNQDSLTTEVLQLLAQGKKINAIKLYRERARVGLKEAKEAVDDLQRTGGAPPNQRAQQDFDSSDSDELRAIHDALRSRKKILAIKLYRSWKNVGLREAKDAVEAMVF